ncbi:MAG TPA: hypothetical protein VF362_03320, partial [Demequinaceae bacterium]
MVTTPPSQNSPWPLALRATYGLAAVVLAGGLVTLLVPNLLTGPAVMNGSAKGTALAMIAVGMPIAVVAALRTRRTGSPVAHAVWLGASAYLVYNSVALCFGTPFNGAFLLYTTGLGLAILVTALLVRAYAPASFGGWTSRRLERAIGVFLVVVTTLNALVWLKVVVPALGAPSDATFLEGSGLITNPFYVQDLAWWIPAFIAAGIGLWRGHPFARLIAGAAVVDFSIESATIAIDQFWGHQSDPASTVATL